MNYTHTELQELLKIALQTGRIQVLSELMERLKKHKESIKIIDLMAIITELLKENK